MSDKELTQLLHDVHTELEGQGAVSDEQRELMREVLQRDPDHPAATRDLAHIRALR